MGIKELIAIDCGANVGSWSIALANSFPDVTIVAFEPSRHAFASLKRNTFGIPFISIENLAVGVKPHQAKLLGKEPGWGDASLINRNSLNMKLAFSELVEVIDLDSYFAKNDSFIPNVLKIDTEGLEYSILLGAISVLKNLRIVQFEFASSNVDSRNYFFDYFNLLSAAGFTLARMSPRGYQDINLYDACDEIFATSNFVAYK